MNMADAELYDGLTQEKTPDVQALIARYHVTLEPFYHATAEIYNSLGCLHVDHPEFRAYYEKYAAELPEFIQRGMTFYANCVLAPKEAS